MTKLTTAVVLLSASLALGQDVTQYNRGLSAFNAGELDTSAQIFYELAENSSEPEVRAKSEYYLAQSFFRKGMPFTALTYYQSIVKAGKAHPFYLKAVEGLVNAQS